MLNVYVHIDPSWSYNLIGGIKDELPMDNPGRFICTLYQFAADFVKISHNFRLTNMSELYNASVYSIWTDLERMGDIPVPYFQVQFRQLYNTHLAVFNSIDKPIRTVTNVTSPEGDLTGFVFELVIEDI